MLVYSFNFYYYCCYYFSVPYMYLISDTYAMIFVCSLTAIGFIRSSVSLVLPLLFIRRNLYM